LALAGLLWVGAAMGNRVAAATLPSSFYCMSLQMGDSTAKLLGLTYALGFSSADHDPIDHELVWMVPMEAPRSHGGFFRLLDPSLVEPIFLSFLLDLPPSQDSNSNLIPDFFEPFLAVESVQTQGEYADPFFGIGPLKATWSRAAQATNGVCKLEFPNLGLTFQPTFEILYFEGTYTYGRQGTNLSGMTSLSNVFHREVTLAGPLRLRRYSNDEMDFLDGEWTNQVDQALAYYGQEPLQRHGNQYFASVFIDDWDPSTIEQSYTDWVLRLVDMHDTDGDGIPDLSDLPMEVRPPELALAMQANGLVLTVRGDQGLTVDLEQTYDLAAGKWTTNSTFVLTSSATTVQLGTPKSSPWFWRAKAKY
jgi:hypothetical protein